MKTDNDTSSTDAAIRRLPGWALQPQAATLATVTLIVAYWMLEAAAHVLLFDRRRSFLHALLFPAPHEAWMRAFVVIMAVALGIAWYAVALERRHRIEEMRSHQLRLGQFTRSLSYGATKERQEVARRLHDDIGQQLSAARMFLSATGGCDDRAASEQVARILERVMMECRELSEELSPPVLEEFGLVPALESLARRVARRSGRTVQVDASHACLGLGHEALMVTFHVLSEVVEAAVEWSDTTAVLLTCAEEEGMLALGVSWDAASHAEFFSAGERIRNVGGVTDVQVDGVRTTFTARVPLAA